MIEVLHLRSSRGLYGAERSLLDLAESLPAPYHARVVSLLRPGAADALGIEAVRRGLQTEAVLSPGRFSLRAPWRLFRLLRRERIGLIHAHDYKSLVTALFAARPLGVPVVATFHGDVGSSGALQGYEALAHRAARWTAGNAAVSEALAQRLRTASPRARVEQIGNGVPLGTPCSEGERDAARAELGLHPARPVLACVGRLSIEKGHSVLFAAMRELARPPELLVVGEGPLRSQLEREASGLPVRFLGYLQPVRRAYAAADVLVLPSRTEGLPLTVLEAMAAGCAVVASAVGELPRVLEGGAGLAVPPEDPNALADALASLLADPVLRRRLVEAGRRRVVERYGLASMVRAYAERLYAPALSSRGVPSSPSALPAPRI